MERKPVIKVQRKGYNPCESGLEGCLERPPDYLFLRESKSKAIGFTVCERQLGLIGHVARCLEVDYKIIMCG